MPHIRVRVAGITAGGPDDWHKLWRVIMVLNYKRDDIRKKREQLVP